MRDEHLIISIPRNKIIREKENSIIADLGDAETILKMCLAALSNPGVGVINKDSPKEEDDDDGQ